MMVNLQKNCVKMRWQGRMRQSNHRVVVLKQEILVWVEEVMVEWVEVWVVVWAVEWVVEVDLRQGTQIQI